MTIYRRPSGGMAAGDAIPFFHDGTYHLFHLSSPPNTISYPERVRTTWQHARSSNLTVWEELPAALLPGEGNQPDADGAWTGSLIERNGVFHLFYTGHKLGSPTPQTICHAVSSDLISFRKDPANPILGPDTSRYELIDWRDPFVFWNEVENSYWMLIAARLHEGPKWRRGCIVLVTSLDLVAWTIEPEPFYAPMMTYCPECPELFRLGEHWYLAFSRFSENAATIYRVGDTPRGPWRVPEREALDGRRWYAAKSMPKGKSARVFFGWVHDRSDDTDIGAWLWGGDFTAPREAIAASSGELAVRLPREVASIYTNLLSFNVDGETSPKAVRITSEEGFDCRFLDTAAETCLLSCRITADVDPASFGILFRSDDNLASYAVVFDRSRKTVTLTRWPALLDTFWADLVGRGQEVREVDGARLVEQPLGWDLRSGIDCSVLTSGSVVEFYIDNQIALSYRVYGRAPHQFGFFVEEGKIQIADLRLAGR